MKKIHGNVVSTTRKNKEKYLSEVLASEDDIGIEYMGGEMAFTPRQERLVYVGSDRQERRLPVQRR